MYKSGKKRKEILIDAIICVALTLSSIMGTLTEAYYLPFPSLYDLGTPPYFYRVLEFCDGNNISLWITLDRLPINSKWFNMQAILSTSHIS